MRGGYEVLNRDQQRWVRELYDGDVSYLDRALGDLFARLKKLGLYEDTLIVFTSDHGEEFWEHGGIEHGHTLYEELLRIPLLIKLPGQTQSRLIEHPVTLENVAPSVLTLCGIEHESDDYSASSLFAPDGTPHEAPTSPLTSIGNLYYEDRMAVIFSNKKYIRFGTGEAGEKEELYDLVADPTERHSLVATDAEGLAEGQRRLEAAQEQARELRKRLGVKAPENTALGEGETEALRDLGYVGETGN